MGKEICRAAKTAGRSTQSGVLVKVCVGAAEIVSLTLINTDLVLFYFQPVSQTGVVLKVGTFQDRGESGVDNGEVFDECSSKRRQ